jgi:hypothetical protein
MRTLLLTSLALTGCMKTNPVYCEHHPEDTAHCNGMMGGDGGMKDAPPDMPTIDARLDFGAGLWAVHVDGFPTMPTISFNPGAMLDTSTSPLCIAPPANWTSNGQPAVCFVYANTITIQDGLEITGTKPVVFLGASSITISGTVDIASHVATAKVAPGSNPAACKAFQATPQSNGSTGGGGAGGSFITLAGDGGAGGGQTAGRAATQDQLAPMVLRGGCDGQTGAPGSMNTPGEKGHGGGAIYFLAGSNISLSSTTVINASGSGGGVASKSSGGGGGGSGGMIVFYAPMVTAATGAKIAANGGSGSTGSNNGSGTVGNDPPSTNPTQVASGPTGTGGSGGAGYGAGNDATSGGSSSNGGGGGGGASGYVQSNVALTGATVSPTEIIGP